MASEPAREPASGRREDAGGASNALGPAFFGRPVVEVARDLLGCTFLFDGVGGRLVEVEAYRADDPASHSYRGLTDRNAVMFGPPGHLYVYFTMGLHFCVNLVCQEQGSASGILLRALEPTHGVELMAARRGLRDPRRLCSGPAKLTQALGITGEHNGLPAWLPPVSVLPRPGTSASDPSTWSAGGPPIVSTPRIGVGTARDVPWRFVDAGSSYLSRPLPRALREAACAGTDDSPVVGVAAGEEGAACVRGPRDAGAAGKTR
jgi:DNA-3-methyladenine glycosylase